MRRLVDLALVSALVAFPAFPNVSQIHRLRLGPETPVAFPAGVTLPVVPDLRQANSSTSGKPAGKLSPESELAIVRYVSGEFARAVRPLPSGKKGLHIRAGAPVDENALREALAGNPIAANPGDQVQITRIVFHATEMVIEVNGGGKKHKSLRERIQVEIGGIPHTTTTPQVPGYEPVGSTLNLDFGGPLPDMTPDQVKQYLAGYLDFSKQRSPAVNWVETLPPEFKKAIGEKRAMVGMDREMVLAAMGPPDQKVRGRNEEGLETEDWIYGHPPAKTIFVTFAGDRVVRVKQFE